MCYDISAGAKTYKYINSDTTGFPSATNNPLHKQRCTHLPPLQQPCCSNAYNTSEIMDISPPSQNYASNIQFTSVAYDWTFPYAAYS